MQRFPSHEQLIQPNGWTIWFTGLSGSGKSTLATALASYLDQISVEYEVIDGDETRRELSHDLGFGKQDRDENIRRIAYVARLLNRHNVMSLVAAISPYRGIREEVRSRCPRFVEVHVDCSLDTLIVRDPKGLYKRALAGDILHFSGVSDPYEAPLKPDIYINSGTQSERQSFAILLSGLKDLGCLPRKSVAAKAEKMRA